MYPFRILHITFYIFISKCIFPIDEHLFEMLTWKRQLHILTMQFMVSMKMKYEMYRKIYTDMPIMYIYPQKMLQKF